LAGKIFLQKWREKLYWREKGSVVLPEVLESDLHGEDGGGEVSQVVD
jgi:hypothetical protein